MFRFLILLAFLSAGISPEAAAVVQQSATDALSYRNVVNNSSVSTAGSAKEVLPSVPSAVSVPKPAPQEADIRDSVSKSVTLDPQGEVSVLLPETPGETWKINYDNDNLSMIGNTANGDVREVKFLRTGNDNTTAYFDRVSSSGEIVENKAVYIKVR